MKELIDKTLVMTVLNKMFEVLEPMDEKIVISKVISQVKDLPTVTADPDTVSRQDVITLVENIENRRLMGEIDLTYAPMLKGVKALPPSPKMDMR